MRNRGYKILVDDKVVDFIKIGKGGKSIAFCKSVDMCVSIYKDNPNSKVESRLVRY